MNSTTSDAFRRHKVLRDITGRERGIPVFARSLIDDDLHDMDCCLNDVISQVFHSEVSTWLRCLKDDMVIASVLRMFTSHLDPKVGAMVLDDTSMGSRSNSAESCIFEATRGYVISLLLSDLQEVFGVQIEGDEELKKRWKRGRIFLHRLSTLSPQLGVFGIFPVYLCASIALATNCENVEAPNADGVFPPYSEEFKLSVSLRHIMSRWFHLLGVGVVRRNASGESSVPNWVAHVIGSYHIFESASPYISSPRGICPVFESILQRSRYSGLTFRDVEHHDVNRILAILEAMMSTSKAVLREAFCPSASHDEFQHFQCRIMERDLYGNVSALIERRGYRQELEVMQELLYRMSLLVACSGNVGREQYCGVKNPPVQDMDFQQVCVDALVDITIAVLVGDGKLLLIYGDGVEAHLTRLIKSLKSQ